MKKKLTLACLATVFTMGYHGKAKGQDTPTPDNDRKVRIEITTTENGNTERVTREFDLTDGEALENALREMGVFDEIGVINDGENLTLELKRMSQDGGTLRDMSMALALDAEEDRGALLGVYGGNWNAEGCDSDGDVKKSSKAVKEGACITGVIEGSAAETAGLKEGDVITRVDDRDIASFSDLAEVIGDHQPGDEVRLTYHRDGKKDDMKVTLGEQRSFERTMFMAPGHFNIEIPDMEDIDWEAMEGANWGTEKHPFLGVDGEDVANNGGARITEVVEATSAESMGIKEGDVIKQLNGTRVLGFTTLAEMIGEMEPGASVAIELERDGQTITVNGTLGEQQLPAWIVPEMPGPPDAPDAPEAPRMYMRSPTINGMVQDEMRQEMDQLRQEMDRLRQELRGEVVREVRVVIATVELNKEETEVLKGRGVTGLDATWQLPDLRCYPNPSSGSFHLQFEVPERGDLAVDIHDAAGERVYHETITGFKGSYERTLDLGDQSDGTYFLVIGQNGKAIARKLIKQ